jgi:SpoVK/Ycf46/Vps4 family AAA+-type ATPase
MSSNVAQTENALQNILLEGLENFKGIFIATTNLIQNLDDAFDRRFIYKMKFSIPDLETSVKIWRKAFPYLSKEDCVRLASTFQFSGGQIDNIARKCEIEYLLSGEMVNLEMMEEFCEKEILIQAKRTNRIGF